MNILDSFESANITNKTQPLMNATTSFLARTDVTTVFTTTNVALAIFITLALFAGIYIYIKKPRTNTSLVLTQKPTPPTTPLTPPKIEQKNRFDRANFPNVWVSASFVGKAKTYEIFQVLFSDDTAKSQEFKQAWDTYNDLEAQIDNIEGQNVVHMLNNPTSKSQKFHARMTGLQAANGNIRQQRTEVKRQIEKLINEKFSN